jgi:heme oxygenase
MNAHQKELIDKLFNTLVEINEEGLDDDSFYNWLNKNYFFKEDLEEVIYKIKEAKKKLD